MQGSLVKLLKSGDLSWYRRSTEKGSPGRPPEEGKKAEREGGRGKTKQKNPQAHPRKNTSTDTALTSDCAKKDCPLAAAKVRSQKLIAHEKFVPDYPLKNGKTGRAVKKRDALRRNNPDRKTDSISPSSRPKNTYSLFDPSFQSSSPTTPQTKPENVRVSREEPRQAKGIVSDKNRQKTDSISSFRP